MQLLQRRARVDAEPVEECDARILIGLQGLRLPAGAVKRDHQLAAESFAERILAGERLELCDNVVVAAELELRIEAVLDGGEPQFLQTSDLALSERRVGKFCKRRASPERRRRLQPLDPLLRRRNTCIGNCTLENGCVHGFGGDAQAVPRGPRGQDFGPEGLAELRDEILERRRGRPRRVLAPDIVDEAIGRNHLVRTDDQRREESPLLLPRQGHNLPFADDFQRAEDSELEHCVCVCSNTLLPAVIEREHGFEI